MGLKLRRFKASLKRKPKVPKDGEAICVGYRPITITSEFPATTCSNVTRTSNDDYTYSNTSTISVTSNVKVPLITKRNNKGIGAQEVVKEKKPAPAKPLAQSVFHAKDHNDNVTSATKVEQNLQIGNTQSRKSITQQPACEECDKASTLICMTQTDDSPKTSTAKEDQQKSTDDIGNSHVLRGTRNAYSRHAANIFFGEEAPPQNIPRRNRTVSVKHTDGDNLSNSSQTSA